MTDTVEAYLRIFSYAHLMQQITTYICATWHITIAFP